MRLSEVTPELRERVLALAPERDQERFSGAARDTLPAAEADPARRPVAVLDDDGEPVAFFVLDTGATMPLHAPGTVGMRAFFVDRHRQRHGFGTAALRALPDFVRAHYPGANQIILTVNVRNDVAKRAYERAGFADRGEVYTYGPLGPQHVLRLDL